MLPDDLFIFLYLLSHSATLSHPGSGCPSLTHPQWVVEGTTILQTSFSLHPTEFRFLLQRLLL